MSSQGSHNDTVNRMLSGERDRLNNDREGDPTKPKKHSILSGYLRTATMHAKCALLDVPCTLLPSFVLGQLRTSIPSSSSSHTRSTSTLDGIRGWACVAVMNWHVLWVYQPRIHYGYGLSRDDMATCIQNPDIVMRNDHFLQLPIPRLLYSGTASMSAFFIISGFVLAYKPLALSRKCRWQDISSTLASSTFRRGIRLYLPAITSSFLSLATFCFWWWQYQDNLTSFNQISTTRISKKPLVGPEPLITSQPTLLLQIQDWLQDLSSLTNYLDCDEYYP